MDKISREEAYSEYAKAWEAFAEAEENHRRMTKGCIRVGLSAAGHPLPLPEVIPDKGWLEQVEEASLKVDGAYKILRDASRRFHDAYQ